MIHSFMRCLRTQHLPRMQVRCFSRTTIAHGFTSDFENATSAVDGSHPFEKSADVLRGIIKTDLVKATDLRDDPAKFFGLIVFWGGMRLSMVQDSGSGSPFTTIYLVGQYLLLAARSKSSSLPKYRRTGSLAVFH